MIKMEKIKKTYRTETIETTALENVDLHVKKGEVISIMGPSGSGKSTLLNIMGLLDDASGGKVEIDGVDINNFQERKLARFRNQKIGFVFQSFHLINDLNVVDNVEIPLIYRKLSGRERRELALEALGKVGLGSRGNHYPNQLSGGQRQRVAIARAIVGNPEIILADEPTGNLDSAMGEEIMSILLDLNRKDNTTIIMVTHDERMAEKTERVVRLFDGRKIG